jgi:drug/metabolite transporter (DMT)-like permease
MISILFGFASALVWGTSDFLGGLFSQRASPYRVTLYAELFGMVALLAAVTVIPQQSLSLPEWGICILAGAIGSLGLLTLYVAMSTGKLSIAAPVSALTAAILPVIAGIVTEGLPEITVLTGFALALVAVWLISRNSSGQESALIGWKDLSLPLAAGVCFGTYFILIHQASQQSVIWPMIGARTGGTIAVFIVAAFKRQVSWSRGFPWPWVMLSGVLDVGGNALYILAGQFGRLDVAAVLSSLYPGMTAVLAWLVLHEKITRSQTVGILTALGAIVLITI